MSLLLLFFFRFFFIILFSPILAKTFKVPLPSTCIFPFRFSSYVRFFIFLHEPFIFTNRIFNIVADSLTDFFYFVIHDLPGPHCAMTVPSSWTSLSLVHSWLEIVVVSLSIRHSFLFSSEGWFLFPQTYQRFFSFVPLRAPFPQSTAHLSCTISCAVSRVLFGFRKAASYCWSVVVGV